MTLAEGTLVGKYVVRRKLTEGGMAEIYLCASQGPEGFEKEVVIKRIRPFLANEPGFREMFIAEAHLASRLNHANLVQIFDFDKHEDTYYLAMEFVRGHSLSEVRKRATELLVPMPPTLVAHVGAEVARGLHYAHRLTDKGKPLGLVHRDVTPHNILLSYDGAVKLTDFGVAKSARRSTTVGVLKGKLAYMSPEQSRGEEVDARTDVFALGIVLWEMLTGGRLFDGDTDMAVLRAVQQSSIAPPARLNPDVPAELDAIVTRALARELPERYQSAQDLERALAHFVLQAARSLEDTDVGAYLRRLFDEGAPEGRELLTDPGEPPAGASPRATQLMRKGPAARARATPPPTDAEGPRATLAGNSPGSGSHEARFRGSTLVITPEDGPAQDVSAPPPASRGTQTGPAAGRRWGLLAGAAALVLFGLVAATMTLGLGEERPQASLGTEAQAPGPAQPASSPRGQGAPASMPRGEGATPGSEAPAAMVRPEAPETLGTLSLTVTPWAYLSIDGKPMGEVESKRVYKLSPGEHTIRLKRAKSIFERKVSIEAGKTVGIEHSFVPGR